jgi:hypothetical protein
MNTPERLAKAVDAANQIANQYEVFFKLRFSRLNDQAKRHRLIAERLRGKSLPKEHEEAIWDEINKATITDIYELLRIGRSPFLFWSIEDSDVVFAGSADATTRWLECWVAVALAKFQSRLLMQNWIEEHPNDKVQPMKVHKRWIRAWNEFDG